jgi:CheY-like chemotaxis protein
MMSDLDVKGWNILIVDDEADNLMVLEVLFSFYDAVVTTTRSGEKALDLLCNNTYRLALLDLQMPKVSGWDLVKRVREHINPVIRNTPLIAVTALAMPGDKERVLASGFDGYISKPLDAVTFVDAVQTILSLPDHQHRTAAAIESPTPAEEPPKSDIAPPPALPPEAVKVEAAPSPVAPSPVVSTVPTIPPVPPVTGTPPKTTEEPPKPAESAASAETPKSSDAETPVKQEPPALSHSTPETTETPAPVAPVAPIIPPAPQTRPLPTLPLGNDDAQTNIGKL